MKCRILLFILLIPSAWLWAKSRTILRYGVVQTNFRKQESQSLNRWSFGVGREYFPKGNRNFFFGYDMMLVRKGVLLQDRTWPGSGFDYSGAIVGDIRVEVNFLEWPIKFGFCMPLFSDRFRLSLFPGVSIATPLGDHSKVYQKGVVVFPDEDPGRIDYDYSDELYMNPTFNLILGAAIEYRFIGIELFYSNALQQTSGFTGLIIEDYFDCWQFLLRLSF